MSRPAEYTHPHRTTLMFDEENWAWVLHKSRANERSPSKFLNNVVAGLRKREEKAGTYNPILAKKAPHAVSKPSTGGQVSRTGKGGQNQPVRSPGIRRSLQRKKAPQARKK